MTAVPHWTERHGPEWKEMYEPVWVADKGTICKESDGWVYYGLGAAEPARGPFKTFEEAKEAANGLP